MPVGGAARDQVVVHRRECQGKHGERLMTVLEEFRERSGMGWERHLVRPTSAHNFVLNTLLLLGKLFHCKLTQTLPCGCPGTHISWAHPQENG